MLTIAILLYLADILPALNAVFSLIGWILLVVVATIQFVNFVEPLKKELKLRSLTVISIILILVSCFIPSKNTMYVLIGLKLGNEVTNTIQSSEYFDKFKIILDKKLDNVILELNQETDKAKK